MKILLKSSTRNLIFLTFIFLAVSCAPNNNGLICYEKVSQTDKNSNEEKELFSILISNSKKTGFVKWYGKGAGDEWEKVDLLTTPDKISFNQPSIELSTEIDRNTLYSKTIFRSIEEIDLKGICKKANIKYPKQEI
jgi:hypothetical protein